MYPSVPSSSRKPMVSGLICFGFKCFAKTTSWGHCDLPLGGISCPCFSLSLWYRTKWFLPGSIISLRGWKMEHYDLIISVLFISWNSWRGRFPWQLLGCPGYSLHRKARLITWFIFFFFPLVFWVSFFLFSSSLKWLLGVELYPTAQKICSSSNPPNLVQSLVSEALFTWTPAPL